jgi:hypothetical protein
MKRPTLIFVKISNLYDRDKQSDFKYMLDLILSGLERDFIAGEIKNDENNKELIT